MTADRRLPSTVAGAYVEWSGLAQVLAARRRATPTYAPPPATLQHLTALERILADEPAPALDDVRARLAWLQHQEREGVGTSPEVRIARFGRLRADLEELERASR